MNDNPDKVVYLNNVTRLDIPAERVMRNVPKLTNVVILGYTEDGEEYFASSYAGGPDVLWLLERLKGQLLKAGEQDLAE